MLSSNRAYTGTNNSAGREFAETFSEEEEEGFQIKEQVFHIITSIINKGSLIEAHKPKTILRNPLCIYTNSNLYVYPQQSEQAPQVLIVPQISDKSAEQTKLVELASNSEPLGKISEFAINSRLTCIYNRHNETLNGKNDLTIYIKNIKTAIQTDMFKPFQKIYTRRSQPDSKYGLMNSQNSEDCPLQFESNYQCGNLHCVYKEQNSQKYYLFLQNDVNTHGYNQWFNFWVSPVYPNKQQKFTQNRIRFKKNQKITNTSNQRKQKGVASTYNAKFYIVNISKDIKFHEGMRILTYRKGKWHYDTPFLYYKNKYQRYNGMNYMTIQFQHEFTLDNTNEDQIVQFCLTYPYSYTKLIKLLKQVKVAESAKWNIELETAGKSEGNNFIYLIKALKKQPPQVEKQNEDQAIRKSKPKPKKCIIVIGRQHPGEAVSSFICHHLVQRILASQFDYEKQCFDWFIFPMTNPDGVIHGNSRTNLKGYDINRCWTKNTVFLSSEVEAINKSIKQIREKYTISYILDIHGHSKDFGSFLYFAQSTPKNKVLNYRFSEKCQIFDYYKSKYGIGYKKRPTLRGQMYYREQIKNTITMQTSLYGYKTISQKGDTVMIPFGDKHFRELASAIYTVLIQNELEELEKQQVGINKNLMIKIEELEKKRAQMEMMEKEKDSDSQPEDEYLQKIERISLGIQIPGKQENGHDKSDHEGISYRYRQNSQPIQFEQKQSIEDRSKIRTALLNRYNKKNKMMKPKRKPIYTNSNVEILSFDKMIQFDKTLKKYSMDQSNQVLPRKTIEEIEQKKNKRAQSQASDERIINGAYMRSQPLVQYPTSSVVKIDTVRAVKFQEQDVFFEKTREWIMKEKKSMAEYKSTQRKRNVKSMIIRPPTPDRIEPSFKQRAKTYYKNKSERKQSLKLAWSLINRQQKPQPKKPSELSKTMLSIVNRAYQSY